MRISLRLGVVVVLTLVQQLDRADRALPQPQRRRAAAVGVDSHGLPPAVVTVVCKGEAMRLVVRITIMKDGIIKQLDTPANIVLNPATEYVRKFYEEVPREKLPREEVLRIESVMDPIDSSEELSDLQVSKDAIIETVAEEVLSQQ